MPKVEGASTRKGSKSGTVFVTFDPKINGFSGLIVEHLYVKFGDPSCVGF